MGRLLRDKHVNVYNCEDAEDRRRMTLLPSLPERTHVCASPTLKPLCGLLGTALGASQKTGEGSDIDRELLSEKDPQRQC